MHQVAGFEAKDLCLARQATRYAWHAIARDNDRPIPVAFGASTTQSEAARLVRHCPARRAHQPPSPPFVDSSLRPMRCVEEFLIEIPKQIARLFHCGDSDRSSRLLRRLLPTAWRLGYPSNISGKPRPPVSELNRGCDTGKLKHSASATLGATGKLRRSSKLRDAASSCETSDRYATADNMRESQ